MTAHPSRSHRRPWSTLRDTLCAALLALPLLAAPAAAQGTGTVAGKVT
jgi:hypothetical protein